MTMILKGIIWCISAMIGMGVVTTAISTYFQDKAKAKVGEICAIIIPYYILFKLLIWLLFN